MFDTALNSAFAICLAGFLFGVWFKTGVSVAETIIGKESAVEINVYYEENRTGRFLEVIEPGGDDGY